MKIGFAARYDPTDRKTWSGISYYTLQQLKKYGAVEIFQYKLPKLLQEWLTTQKSINRRWFKKQTAVEFLKAYATYFSKQLTEDLKKRPVDFLFVSASPQLIAYIETDIPIIYMTDATFQQLQGYYPSFRNLAGYNIRQGINLDKKAFQNMSHALLASEWCKQSAVSDYLIEPAKITVVPFGANMDAIPLPGSIPLKIDGELSLLFLAVEWERKGGDIVLETFRLLRNKNIPVRLHIIGCHPPVDVSMEEHITVISFIDKNNPEESKQLDSIFKGTDLLFLPTRAECAGVVFSESSAYAIPSITTDTGGVNTYVKNGRNGFVLPYTASPSDYADKISQLFANKQSLQELKKSSRLYYENNLSWELWGLKFREIAENLLAHRSSNEGGACPPKL